MEVTSVGVAGDGHPLRQRLAGTFAKVLHHFGAKGFWALTDQGVVSAADFLTLNLLARWFTKANFGVYGNVLETLLWVNALQSALVLYPLTIRGAAASRRDLRGPATAALFFTLALAPLLGGGFAIGARFNSGRMLVVAAGAISMLLWQCQETVRQALKTHLRFAAAVPGDCIRHLGQVLGVVLLHKSGRLDVASAFLMIGVAAALATLLQAMQVGLVRVTAADLRLLARDFWVLGRWMLPAAALSIFTSLGYLDVLQYYYKEEAAGTMNAVVLPLKVTVPVSIGLASVITPAVANTMKRLGTRAATPAARQLIFLGIVLLVPYYLLVMAFPHLAMHVFLGHRYAEYREATPFVRLYVINAAAAFMAVSLGAWLGGLGQSRLLFVTQVIKALFGICIALPATAIWGIPGLIIGNIFALSLEAACYLYFIRRVNSAVGGAAHAVATIRHLKTTHAPIA